MIEGHDHKGQIVYSARPEMVGTLMDAMHGAAICESRWRRLRNWLRRWRWPVGCEVETVGLGGRVYAKHRYWRGWRAPPAYTHIFVPPSQERRNP